MSLRVNITLKMRYKFRAATTL